MTFGIKDSGKRKEFDSGMVRDVTDDKVKWHLLGDGPMLERWAEHLTRGAQKYTDRNWMKANGEEEASRFMESAWRHFMQWTNGNTDEDHAAAVFFNINGYEYVRNLTNVAKRDTITSDEFAVRSRAFLREQS